MRKKFISSLIFILLIGFILIGIGLSQPGLNLLSKVGQPLYRLTVTKSGTGMGMVTSAPLGINCGSTCSYLFPMGNTIVLTAIADLGSVFTGWTGSGCSGTGTCSIIITGDMTVNATFGSSVHTYTYAYFGHVSAFVTRVKLSDFTIDSTLATSVGTFYCANIDLVRRKALFGTTTSPGRIIFIDIDSFTEVGSITLDVGENNVTAISVDMVNGIAYVVSKPATNTYFIIKIDTSTMTRIPGSLAYNGTTADKPVYGSAQDSNYVYIGGEKVNPNIFRIDKATFTASANISTASADHRFLYGTDLIEIGYGLFYMSSFGNAVNYDRIFKVDTSTFTITGSVDYAATENQAYIVLLDEVNRKLYGVPTIPNPDTVVRFDAPTMVREASISLDAGENTIRAGVFDSLRDCMYLGMATGPATDKIIKVGTNPFSKISSISPGIGSTVSAVVD